MTTSSHVRAKAVLIIAATFVLGTVTGAALNGMYLQASAKARERPAPSDMPVFESLRRELSLTDAQSAAIRAATEEVRREFRGVRLERCPGLADARGRLLERVRALLTAQQQEQFDTLVSQRRLRGESPRRGEP